MKKRLTLVVVGVLCVLVSAIACSQPPAPDDATGGILQSLTETAVAQSLAATAAVTATPSASEEFKEPTATPGVDIRGTVEAEVTATAQARQTTEAAASSSAAATADAQTAAEQPVRDALPRYGVDPAAGRVAWMQDGIVIETEGFESYQWQNTRVGTVVRDFVLSADITWNTRFGTTGCGFILRTDDNEDAGNRYVLIITRGAQGHAIFTVQKAGEVSLDDTVDMYANGIDPLFEWQNDTTNRLTVVGRGDAFDVYTNNTYLDTVEPGYGFLEGFVAFVALNESGDTRCAFDNAWLWLIE
jgi:hypothetical protein